MGRKLDALLGRNLKASKFKTLAKLAISRISILKNQHHVRCSHAQSDVIQLLVLGHQERALLRVEHVIREQNMFDVFVMIESYCHILIERVVLIKNNRECPDELEEAISTLIFAASRCGGFPELQHIRENFTSSYGKEFVARAIELRNNCGVNRKMIQWLSTRQASLESRMNVLKQIASDSGIALHLQDEASVITMEKQDVNQKQEQLEQKEIAILDDPQLGVDADVLLEDLRRDEKFSESVKARKKFRDASAAAQEAFESAVHAAAAARATVELSRSESREGDPDDHCGSNHQQRIVFDSDWSTKSKLQIQEDADSEDVKQSEKGLGFDKIDPIDSFSSESEDEEMVQSRNRSHLQELERRNKKLGLERTISASTSNSDGDNLSDRKASSNLHENEPQGEEIVFDVSEDETGENQDNIPWLKHHDMGSDNFLIHSFTKSTQYNAVEDINHSDKRKYKHHYRSPEWIPEKSQADPMTHSVEGRSRFGNIHQLKVEEHLYVNHSDRDKKPTSVRTRRVHRH